MSSKRPFTPEDKSRIQRAETLQYNGMTRVDSLAAKVQRTVDSRQPQTHTTKHK